MENQENSEQKSSPPGESTEPIQTSLNKEFIDLVHKIAVDIHQASEAIKYACRLQVEMLTMARKHAEGGQAPAVPPDPTKVGKAPWDDPY